MCLKVVILTIVAATFAAPQNENLFDQQIVRYDTENDGHGTYSFNYELVDGTKREERGELMNAGTDQEEYVVRGSYEWIAPDGTTWTVTFTADKNGYRPKVEPKTAPPLLGAVAPGVVASLLG